MKISHEEPKKTKKEFARVVFDSKNERFPGDGEANKYLSRAYRSPFTVPTNV